MKNIFYYTVRSIMELGFYFYFKKITVYGKEKIPREGGVIVSPNHQNGIIDPFVVGGNYPDVLTSLTRADVFGGFFHSVFTAMNMIPVYRIRDGFDSLKYNDSVFEKCYKLLESENSIQIFSEARQHENYFLIPISKGSSRLAFNAQKKYPNKNIYLQPVGINYSSRRNPLAFIHLVYGDPILVKEYIDPAISEPKQINLLRNALQSAMKSCLWIPDNGKEHEKQCEIINNLTGKESFDEIRKTIKNIDKTSIKNEFWSKSKHKEYLLNKLVGGMGLILNWPILYLTKLVLSKIDDVVYYSTAKFYCALFFLPIWWILQWIFISSYGIEYSIITVFSSIISLYIRQNNRL